MQTGLQPTYVTTLLHQLPPRLSILEVKFDPVMSSTPVWTKAWDGVAIFK
jgi:hypothetical protein